MHDNIETRNRGSAYVMQRKQVTPRNTSVRSIKSFKKISMKVLASSNGHRWAEPTKYI